jgi:ribosomal protein S18 acetylase RimI-like enzyme
LARLHIRKARQADLELMAAIDHKCAAGYAYKMEEILDKSGSSHSFQRVRLPRTATINYPREGDDLFRSWAKAEMIFVGLVEEELVAYTTLETALLPRTARVVDLVVAKDARRSGVGASMLAACEAWAREKKLKRLLVEAQLRNDPIISLLKKAGYVMCGYLESYFPNSDTAVFFEKRLG